jgi:hypothetical protein
MKKIQDDPSLAFRIMETMSRRVRTLTEEVARLRKEGHDGPGPASA